MAAASAGREKEFPGCFAAAFLGAGAAAATIFWLARRLTAAVFGLAYGRNRGKC